MEYKVKIKDFEGPLDLLVYLIESAKMDIYDIKISIITRQYIEYINEAMSYDVEVSTEFMIMASTLIDLKAKMLIPKRVELEEEEFEDPREELVLQLIEYKKVKRISEFFRENESENFNRMTKPQEDIESLMGEELSILKVDPDTLIRQFKIFLDKKIRVNSIEKKYTEDNSPKETIPIKLEKIKNFFRKFGKKKVNFTSLLGDSNDKYDKVLTFASILEMVNKKKVLAKQETTYGKIELSATDAFLDEMKEEEI